jgi:hypothetical protein
MYVVPDPYVYDLKDDLGWQHDSYQSSVGRLPGGAAMGR